ncbi:MAG: hypothetical protein ACK57I_07610, partial [Akkermansiaceae bacterium]
THHDCTPCPRIAQPSKRPAQMAKNHNKCRYCGRHIIIRRRVFNPIINRWIEGNPFLVFHPDGLPCPGPGGQQFLNL